MQTESENRDSSRARTEPPNTNLSPSSAREKVLPSNGVLTGLVADSVSFTLEANSFRTLPSAVYHSARCAEFPHEAQVHLKGSIDIAEVLALGYQELVSDSNGPALIIVLKGEDHVLEAAISPTVSHFGVAARSRPRALEIAATLDEVFSLGIEDENEGRGVNIWAGKNLERHHKTIRPPRWKEIAQNYPKAVRSQLEELVAQGPPASSYGRLLVFHGPPGTGKTSFVRCLTEAWSEWAQFEVCFESDALLGDSLALVKIAEAPPIIRGTNPWRVVVLDDVDADRLRDGGFYGAELTNLLNASSGILGDDMKVIVLVSTNARLDRITPALTRPGRLERGICFDPFPAQEASAWLGKPVGRQELTLAELYEAKEKGVVKARSNDDAYGIYL